VTVKDGEVPALAGTVPAGLMLPPLEALAVIV